MNYTVQKGDFNLIEDGIEVNKTAPRPYIGMPIEIDDDDISDTEKEPECIGNLENLPLAMAYVPWQSWEETYEPAEGLKNGTIFPCLNLPFLGGRCK